MKKIVLTSLFFLLFTPPLLAYNTDFVEMPTYGGLRELVSAKNAYQNHRLKTVDYVANVLIPGYLRRTVRIVRVHDPNLNEHEVIPMYSFSFWEGVATETGKRLDFHIDAPQGRGYFNIKLPTGIIAYTKDGRFRVDFEGKLVTIAGNYPVLGHNGIIYVKSNDISVSRSGTLYNEGEKVDRFKITVFDHIADMGQAFSAISGSFFTLKFPIPKNDYSNPNETYPFAVLQGFVTQSNSFDSKDGPLYDNYYKASHNALIMIIDSFNSVNTNMLGTK
jgi:flagellar basal body rod protein FlgF